MKITKQIPPHIILQELGQRLARRRLDLGLTQAEAADEAGVGKRTVERIEGGGDTQVSTLIRLLRVLELVEGLDQLVPKAKLRPLDLLKLKGKQRKRASSRGTDKPTDKWQWGDEK